MTILIVSVVSIIALAGVGIVFMIYDTQENIAIMKMRNKNKGNECSSKKEAIYYFWKTGRKDEDF